MEDCSEACEHLKLRREDGILELTLRGDDDPLDWGSRPHGESGYCFVDVGSDSEQWVVMLTGIADVRANEDTSFRACSERILAGARVSGVGFQQAMLRTRSRRVGPGQVVCGSDCPHAEDLEHPRACFDLLPERLRQGSVREVMRNKSRKPFRLLLRDPIEAGRTRVMGAIEESNKELVRVFLDALSRADVETVDKLYADDFSIWVTGSLPFSGTKDKAQALEGMPQVLGLFPEGLTFEITAMTAEGDRVAIEATSRGTTFRGDLYEQEYHFLLRARDGKIVEWKEYMDTEKARRVLVGE